MVVWSIKPSITFDLYISVRFAQGTKFLVTHLCFAQDFIIRNAFVLFSSFLILSGIAFQILRQEASTDRAINPRDTGIFNDLTFLVITPTFDNCFSSISPYFNLFFQLKQSF